MQQDRLIGAAGEGRYESLRGWAGRPEYGNALLVREPLADRDAERLELGLNRSAHPGGRRGCRVARSVGRRDPSPPRPGRTRPSATSRRGSSSTGSTPRRAADAQSSSATSTPSRRTGLRRGWPRGLPVRVRRGERRRARGHLAVRHPGAGDGHRRRAGLPRLHLGPRRGPASRAPASRSTGRRSDDPTLYPSDHLGCRLTLAIGEARPWPCASPTAATGARRPRTRSPAFLAALDVPGCDGLEFDVRASAGRRAGPAPRRDARAGPGRRRAGRGTLGRRPSSGHGVPTLEDVLAAVPRRAFLDVELKGDPGRGAVDVLTAGRGPGLGARGRLVVRAGALERVGRLAPPWPRWLNAIDLSAGDDRPRRRARLPRRSRSTGARSTDGRRPRPGRGPRGRGLDRPPARRPSSRPRASGRRRAICVEGAALDGCAGSADAGGGQR